MKNIDSLSKTTSGPDYKKIKKWGIIGGAAVCLCAVLVALFVAKGNSNILDIWAPDFGADSDQVESIMLSHESLTLEMNGAETLQATVAPAKFKDSVVWKTSDPAVVSVSNGLVRSIAPGIASVTVESADGFCIAKCQVIVQKSAEKAKYEISDTRIVLAPGGKDFVSILEVPSKVVDSTVIWASSNEKVVTVAKNGQLTAVDFGSAVVSASDRMTKEVIATCVVTVKANLESITLDKNTLTLSVNSTATLMPTINPTTATNKSVTWESSNKGVATVDAKGVVKAIKPGTATITCTTVDGELKAACNVSVQANIEKVVINESSVMIGLNEKRSLSTTVWPETISDRSLTWSSSNPTVVSVDERGSIMGLGYGTAVITAKANADPSMSGTCRVTVTRDVTGITLNKTSENIMIGSTILLIGKVVPSNADNRELIWTSEKESIARVDSTGLVTGVGVGTTTIRCESVDGGFEASCDITVTAPVEKIEFSHDSIIVEVGRQYTGGLNYIVTPAGAEPNVRCYSSNTTIATVTDIDGTLYVKGIAPGVTSIVVEATDGSGRRATLPVSVNMVGFAAFTSAANTDGTVSITGLSSDWKDQFQSSSISIPGMIDGKTVSAIADGAFDGKLSGITSVRIPENVISIGGDAFANNAALTSVTLPDSLMVIGSGAFESTGLTAVSIPGKCSAIAPSAFKNCLSLATVILKDGLLTIGESAFSGAVMLSAMAIPSTVTDIGSYAFYNTGLNAVTFSTNKLEKINAYAFAMTNIKKAVVPNGVTTICEGAFSGNVKLGSILLPDSVTQIEKSAFENCSNLSTIWMSEKTNSIANMAFNGINPNCVFAVTAQEVKTLLDTAGIPAARMIQKTDALYNAML